jgi:hypothetical protein
MKRGCRGLWMWWLRNGCSARAPNGAGASPPPGFAGNLVIECGGLYPVGMNGVG